MILPGVTSAQILHWPWYTETSLLVQTLSPCHDQRTRPLAAEFASPERGLGRVRGPLPGEAARLRPHGRPERGRRGGGPAGDRRAGGKAPARVRILPVVVRGVPGASAEAGRPGPRLSSSVCPASPARFPGLDPSAR